MSESKSKVIRGCPDHGVGSIYCALKSVFKKMKAKIYSEDETIVKMGDKEEKMKVCCSLFPRTEPDRDWFAGSAGQVVTSLFDSRLEISISMLALP